MLATSPQVHYMSFHLDANRRSFLTNCVRGGAHKKGKRRDLTTTCTLARRLPEHGTLSLSISLSSRGRAREILECTFVGGLVAEDVVRSHQ